MKKILIVLCLVAFLHPNNSQAMSGVTELGLSVAAATMDSKSIEKGLSNVAKDQTKEWLSDSVGGLEKMMLQNSEAEINDAIGKITEIVDIVKSIEKIAIAIDAGNYDMAAIEAMDQVVGKVNHPLVSLTWSAVKLTYESHKLVISTESARQVEILYYIVNKDRMLLGVTDPSSNTPPEIPINRDTADYFFNKYIMTNDNARRALKAYVTTVLGQDWPEQSWSEWLGGFRTIGMGLDTKKNAELEMLDKEWRNKGRTWVISVIKEINKQARQNWAKLKLRQEIAAFQKFTQSVISFKQDDLPRMLKDFKEIQKYKKELPLYKKELEKSIKIRGKIAKKVASLSKEVFKHKSTKTGTNDFSYIVSLVSSWKAKTYTYASMADFLQKKELASSLYVETNAWRKIKDDLDNFIATKGETIAKELASEKINIKYSYSNMSPKNRAKMQAFNAKAKEYSENFFSREEYRIKPFAWDFKVAQVGSFYIPKDINIPSKVGDFSKELLAVLNRGEIRLAQNMELAYNSAAGVAFWGYSYDMMRASKGYFSYPAPSDLPLYDDSEDKRAKNRGWQMAKSAILEKAKVMYQVEVEKYNKKMASISKIMRSFQKLKTARKTQWALYSSHIGKILNPGDYAIDMQRWLEISNECQQNAYTKLNIIDNDTKYIVGVLGVLNSYARKIKSSPACFDSDGLIETRETFKKQVDIASKSIDEFKKLPPLTSKDIREISVLSASPFEIKQSSNRVEKMVKQIEGLLLRVDKTEKNIAKIKQVIPLIDKIIPISELDLQNRERDITWLKDKAKDVEAFIAYMINSGKLKRGHTEEYPEIEFSLVLPKNTQFKDKMLISYDSPIHYLGQNEINTLAQPLIRMYEGTKIQIFLNTYFPKVSRNLSTFLSLKFIKPAQENIIVRNKVIFASDLKKLEDILEKVNISRDDFDKKISGIPECFPSVEVSRNFYFEDKYIDKTELNKTILGEKFIKLREKVKELFLLRRAFLIKKEQELNRIKNEEEIKKREEELNLKNIQEDEEKTKEIENIESLYSKFTQYYSDKNIASLMSLISDEWVSSSDGTTLMDLEDTLNNSFSIFDEVKCSIYSLNIERSSLHNYKVTYAIDIVGFIYDEDIEHNEKSSVTEELTITNGIPKIVRTLSGRYWKTR